jgi:hypothetical protein
MGRRIGLGLSVAGAVTMWMAWVALPAFAHGEEGESDLVDQVEQALAIVVNTPDAVDEALERIEAALDAEAEEPSGELDVAALELAADALRDGRLHDAEDDLIEALGQDPHGVSTEPGASAESDTDAAGGPSEHGLTERVDGGVRSPTTGGWTAIGVAAVAAALGVALVRRKEASM